MTQRGKQSTGSKLLWNYFIRLPENKVKCALCDNELSFNGRTTTSNLIRHLRSLHPMITDLPMKRSLIQFDEELGPFEDLQHEPISGRPTNEESSWIQIRDGYHSNNLREKRHRSTVLEEETMEEAMPVGLQEETVILGTRVGTHFSRLNTPLRGRHSISAIWTYFTRLPNEKARCDLCSNELSFRGSSTSNLIRHMRLKHPSTEINEKPASVVLMYEESESLEDGNQDDISCTKEQQSGYEAEQEEIPSEKGDMTVTYCRTSRRERHSSRPSAVWDFFTHVSKDKVKCELCSNVLSYRGVSTSNLNRHIRTKHSTISLKASWNQSEYGESPLDNEQGDSADENEKMKNEEESLEEGQEEEEIYLSFKDGPRDRHSAAWDYFTRVAIDKVKCNLCSNVLSFKRSSTSNLNRHLRLKHLDKSEHERGPVEDAQQMIEAMSDANEQSASVTESHYLNYPYVSSQSSDSQNQTKEDCYVIANKKKYIDEQLLLIIVKQYLHLSIVESAEFQSFVKALNPNYELPSRKTLSNNLLNAYYSKTMDTVKKDLQNASYVCITTDSWISVKNDHYMAITVHFVDIDCTLKSYLISCFRLDECSSENILQAMMNVLSEWNLAIKVVACVTDNATDIVGAVHESGWCHVPCFAHALNLIVKTSIEEIQETRLKVKSIVQYFKRKSEASEMLVNTQLQMGEPVISLKQDVGSHWNTTYDMFERILRAKDPLLQTILLTNPADLQELTDEDWCIIQKTCDILKCFQEVTVELRSESNVTISKVALLMKALANICKNATKESCSSQKLNVMMRRINEQLKIGFEVYENLNPMWEATFLDPRFKRYGFPTESKFEEIKQGIINETCCMQQDDRNTTSSQSPKATNISSSIWQDFDSDVVHLVQTENSRVSGTAEVEKYLNQPLLSRHENPLKWWKENKTLYPRLFLLVQRRFCIVATSVSSERIFSKEGRANIENRSNLTTDKVTKIVFLNANMKKSA